MGKKEEAKDILKSIEMPATQQTELCALTFLALANVKEETPWSNASNNWIGIHDVIVFCDEAYDVQYAENSRESIRKLAMAPFRQAALVEDNGKATNSPNYKYRLTEESLDLIRKYGEYEWSGALEDYVRESATLSKVYASRKKMAMMPVKINAKDFSFSPGEHNELQKAILEEFAPRFAPDSVCLYVGDTIKKDLYKDEAKLNALGFEITLHDKMPDIVLYQEENNWIYFIEAVASCGPMSPKRVVELEEMTKNVNSGIIYVTAFPDIKMYTRFAKQLAWETEVWLADEPDHLIHLNGDKFLGPR